MVRMLGRFFFVKCKASRYHYPMEIPDRDFDAYIFDCDGTLADTMGLHYEAWKMALEPHGADLPEELYYSWGGRPTKEIIESLNEMQGLFMDPVALSRHKEGLYHTLLPEVREISAVVAFARSMHGKKPLAVASGGGRKAVTATLEGLGILGLFDAVVTSEDYANGKPSPDPYLTAARLLGVDPSGCLVFEDTEIGRQSALSAGMECVLVKG
jgi:beta-phosphoglucomutase-like phosphatase (HAD superfamily)